MFVTLESKPYKFKEFASGLYYYDTANIKMCDKFEVDEADKKEKTRVNDYLMLQTVKGDKEF